MGGKGEAARRASTALAPSAGSSARCTATLLAEPATSTGSAASPGCRRSLPRQHPAGERALAHHRDVVEHFRRFMQASWETTPCRRPCRRRRADSRRQPRCRPTPPGRRPAAHDVAAGDHALLHRGAGRPDLHLAGPEARRGVGDVHRAAGRPMAHRRVHLHGAAHRRSGHARHVDRSRARVRDRGDRGQRSTTVALCWMVVGAATLLTASIWSASAAIAGAPLRSRAG